MKLHCVDRTMATVFRKLGYQIGRYPSYFVIIPIFLSGILATGFQRMYYERDPYYLSTPKNAPSLKEQEIVENFFPMNLSYDFNPGRITKIIPYARIIIEAQDSRSVLDEHVFRQILSIDAMVKNITIIWKNEKWRYKDLCARKKDKCFENDVIKLNIEMFSVKYPIYIDEFKGITLFTGSILGEVEVDNKTNNIKSARSVNLMYFLDNSNADKAQRASLWEKEFIDVMTGMRMANISLGLDTSLSLETEMDKVIWEMIPYAIGTGIVTLLFSVVTCMMTDWVRSKIWLGVIGCVVSGLAVASAFGLLMYCGVVFTSINIVGSLLMLGIGMDDSFILLAAWRRTSINRKVPDRIAECFSEAGVSITITSLTNIIAFCIGITTPFPVVQNFCTYTATAVLFTYLYQICVFGGALAAHGYMEEKNLHAFICVPVIPRSRAQTRNAIFRLLCTGGVSTEDLDNREDNKEHFLMVFFRDYLGKLLTLLPMKIFVIVLFLGYIGVSVWGCTQIIEGLENDRMVLYDSYSSHYYRLQKKHYSIYPFRIQVVINETLNYANPSVQNDIENLLQRFENITYIAGPELTESWLRAYLQFTADNRTSMFLKGLNMSKEEDFWKGLRSVFLKFPVTANMFQQDLVFNDNGTEITSSRFVIQAYNITSTEKEKGLLVELRRIAKNTPFHVTVHSPIFSSYDHLLLIRDISIQTIAVTAAIMLLISLVFIPSITCAIWVAFSVVSIEAGVAGFMALWGVNLDPISMVSLIMCIGFSVDHSAHASYAFVSHRGKESNECIRHTLHLVGLPIFQGSVTTIFSVLAISFVPCYIFLVIFRTMTLVVLFGVAHAFFLLPVLLSLTDCRVSRKTTTNGKLSVNVVKEEQISIICKYVNESPGCRKSDKTGENIRNQSDNKMIESHTIKNDKDVANNNDECEEISTYRL